VGAPRRPRVVLAVSWLAAALVLVTAMAARQAVRATRAQAGRRRMRAHAGPHDGRGLALLALPAPPWLERWLERAGSERPASSVWSVWVVCGAAGPALALVVAGAAVAVLVAACAVVIPVVVLHTRRHRGGARLEEGLPGALEAMARSLRSGAGLRQAVGEAAVATPELARQAGQGASLVEALEGLAARHPMPGCRLAVAALCLGVETGGAQARAVDGVAATLRDRLAVTAEVKALASQARVSAMVIGLAPLAFGAFAVTTDPRTGDFLFNTPVGIALLTTGVVLDGLGWLWMQRLTRVAL
jgi:tight adherence protein B